MAKVIISLCMLLFYLEMNAQQTVTGTVMGQEIKEPLVGASIIIKGTKRGTVSDANGRFAIKVSPNDTLVFSSMGYLSRTIIPPYQSTLQIEMEVSSASLEQIIVSTGYQTLPKERATGSFSFIDNKLLNRSVGTNVIDRLKDVIPGLSFNTIGSSSLSVRGQSTLFGNAEPLIVVDNFPFEGNLQDINPNDVESITVLRDAAASSIWGARAGNGVIVITTSKGRLNQAVQITLNSNLTIVDIPDLYVTNKLSSADYIDIEKRLFAQGYYDASQLTSFEPLTPVVELLYAKKANPANGSAIDAQIEDLKGNDVRNDFARYVYRKAINQQYSLNLKGGGKSNSYYVSLGYDQNRENMVGNNLSRISLAAMNTFKLLEDKLELSTGINFSIHNTANNAIGTSITNLSSSGSIYPYAKLADESGSHLSLIKNYRSSFINSAKDQGLLDWTYVPLDEPNLSEVSNKRKTVRLNGSLVYSILNGLKASLRYQFTDVGSLNQNFRSQESYFVRDLINRFSQLSAGNILRPIPLGGILDVSNQTITDHGLRGQLDFNRSFGTDHELTTIVGFELRRATTSGSDYRYYGYDEANAQNNFVNYANDALPLFYDSSRRGQIPFVDAIGLYNDRFRSYYTNSSYTYLSRYSLSASARLDQSNLFGVRTNQKGVPLWSVGGAWQIDKEPFYRWDFLPQLKLRATYGYNGSVNKTVSAYTTAEFSGYLYNRPYATIINPPNPSLRWERIKILNFGLDFGLFGNRVSGSAEFYRKQGLDLIGDLPMAPSSGVLVFRGNSASTMGTGFEFNLSSKNTRGRMKWQTDFIFSTLKERVTEYAVASTVTQYIQSGTSLPLMDRPLYAMYSYQWAGLDPVNGDPKGYINGQESKDYLGILRSVTPANINYNGSRRPTTFGAVRNSFNYGNVSLSLNISYRLGYVFRKNSVVYGNNYGLSSNNGDYALRWQHSGDEKLTYVPSLPMSVNNNRDLFFRYSDVLVDRADNIRLQDLRIDYSLKNKEYLPFGQIQFYLYCTNFGILWKATKFDVDPDIQHANNPFSMAFGIKVNFK